LWRWWWRLRLLQAVSVLLRCQPRERETHAAASRLKSFDSVRALAACIRAIDRRNLQFGLQNGTVQADFIAIGKNQAGEVDLQSARVRSGVLLIDFVDHTFDVGSGRNGNLIIDDHRRLRLQVDRLTALHGFGVDGDDE
jgi:hypothetical protein